MGSTVGENDNLFYESIVSGFGVTGHSRAMLPNRVSYWLNLKGTKFIGFVFKVNKVLFQRTQLCI